MPSEKAAPLSQRGYMYILALGLLMVVVATIKGFASLLLLMNMWRCTEPASIGEYRTPAPGAVCAAANMIPNGYVAFAVFGFALFIVAWAVARWDYWYCEVPIGEVAEIGPDPTVGFPFADSNKYKVAVKGMTRSGQLQTDWREVTARDYYARAVGDRVDYS